MLRKTLLASVLTLLSAGAFAATCEVTINSTDAMTFESKAIEISKSCEKFTVHLKHTGQLAKNVMGHNLVIAKTADMQPITTEALAQGVDKDYLKADDPRIVAHTKMIGGGEQDSVTFEVAKLSASEPYSFFCTFPGHAALMNGAVTLVD
ncbi:azurin [Ventosimonas gracilis]|uniref:Azurin n=1 Tax=Ventosimonas gracilis TaxID=1680762 RepID=A0A139SXC2_9GAMM|nr:azurin [Ventosimonas gracilis]KXU39267.1 azurin [Ventosimonas gracilis]